MASSRHRTLVVTPVCSLGNPTESAHQLAVPVADCTLLEAADMVSKLVCRKFGPEAMSRLYVNRDMQVEASDFFMADELLSLGNDGKLQVWLAAPPLEEAAIVQRPRRGHPISFKGRHRPGASASGPVTAPSTAITPFTIEQNAVFRSLCKMHLSCDSKGSIYPLDDPRQDKSKLPALVAEIRADPCMIGVAPFRVWKRLSQMSALRKQYRKKAKMVVYPYRSSSCIPDLLYPLFACISDGLYSCNPL